MKVKPTLKNILEETLHTEKEDNLIHENAGKNTFHERNR